MIRFFVSSLIEEWPRKARDTVVVETPAFSAITCMLIRLGFTFEAAFGMDGDIDLNKKRTL